MLAKEQELTKLFETVVAYETSQNPMNAELMREAKNLCVITWPDDANRIIRDAYRYVNSQKMRSVGLEPDYEDMNAS